MLGPDHNVRWLAAEEIRERIRSGGGRSAADGTAIDVSSIRQWRDHAFAGAPRIVEERIGRATDERGTTLSLSGLRLTELPDVLWKVRTLEHLDLSGNHLT